MKNERDRCIALAGVFQAAELASQVAHRGMADTEAMEASIHSLFQLNADSVAAVYNGLPGITTGLRIVAQQLEGANSRTMETTRYVISLLHLERKLHSNGNMQEKIASEINSSNARLAHYPMLHSNILAGIADLYSETISTLKPRIMVQGDPLHLKNPENINKIRSLLLAGIRSAMLWRQCGGGRLKILIGRKRLLQVTHDLIREIRETD
ncbi:MAG: high frequency lysogenization protein HflD [Gammaproteobacteria bacterium]|nr:high frequency lysogenization protein HflD [Gammaproteobacteria bacterium]